eukprot:s1484_g5.t1
MDTTQAIGLCMAQARKRVASLPWVWRQRRVGGVRPEVAHQVWLPHRDLVDESTSGKCRVGCSSYVLRALRET